MALPSTIHRVTMELADLDRGVFQTIQTTAARHPSETAERLVARLLALALFYEPELAFTRGLCATDEPDLWVLEPDGRSGLWVEVGLPDADRIIKASRHSGRVALLACGRALSVWNQQQFPKLETLTNLTVVAIDQETITSLAAGLDRTISWSLTVTEGIVFLTSCGTTSEIQLICRKGER